MKAASGYRYPWSFWAYKLAHKSERMNTATRGDKFTMDDYMTYYRPQFLDVLLGNQ